MKGGGRRYLYNVALEVDKRAIEREKTYHFVPVVIVMADVSKSNEGLHVRMELERQKRHK